MRIVVDTNVILDIFLKREPFFAASYGALRKAVEADVDCFVSATAVTDVFYILRKNLKSSEQAKGYLSSLMQLVSFSDVLSTDIAGALASEMADFEDAVVDAVASRMGAQYILTRNTKDFVRAKTKAIAPEAYANL